MNGNKIKKSGFTLMEILVVLGVFSIMTVLIVSIFIFVLQTQRQTAARQKTLSNLRYVVETIGRQVRTSEVDYNNLYDKDGDFGIIGAEQEIYLINQDGKNVSFYLDPTTKELKMSVDGVESLLVSSADIEVTNLSFYISPATNPFTEERCNIASDCQNLSLGCTLSGKVCQGGVNNGQVCTGPADCPGGICYYDPQRGAGFCRCDINNDCRTGYCQPDEKLCLPVNQQPKVTMILGFKSKSTKIEEQKTIFLQTSFVSRVYKR
jgi:prepilin-type N-terminal cleavage/methylation domain-containing protein